VEQVLAYIIWLLIQCLYYEAGTDSYTMLVGSMLILEAGAGSYALVVHSMFVL
jgi:hypothetical protein